MMDYAFSNLNVLCLRRSCRDDTGPLREASLHMDPMMTESEDDDGKA